jgi:probable HAF family extracellular repeat protein
MKRYTLAAVTALLVLFPWQRTVGAGAPLYSVENLGSFNGMVPTITGINASGQVVGNVSTNGSMPVRYTDGVGWESLTDLNTRFSVATGINSSGEVVGYHLTAGNQIRAFRYHDGFPLEDVEPLPGGSMTLGLAINDAGEVAGYGNSSAGVVAFRAAPALPAVALPSLGGGFAQACGINASGQVAGLSVTSSGAQHGIRVDDGAAFAVDIASLDGPDGTVSVCAIDTDGRVGGQADHGGLPHAFLFGATGGLDVDTFGSLLSNIESIANGVAAGWYTGADGFLRALAYTDADGTFDLNTRLDAPGWVLVQAKGVNVHGAIAGEGTLDGAPAVFRLTPAAAGDTTAPLIAPHGNETAEAASQNGAVVAYSAPATSDDVDGNGTASCSPVSGSTFALGTTTVTCNATDAAGNAAVPTTFTVTVTDTTAPEITALAATPAFIWPANGKWVAVSIAVSADDEVDQAPVCALSGISGGGAGDSAILGPSSAKVRAERSPNGADREYLLEVSCHDAAGNTSVGAVTATVGKSGQQKVYHYNRPLRRFLLGLHRAYGHHRR